MLTRISTPAFDRNASLIVALRQVYEIVVSPLITKNVNLCMIRIQSGVICPSVQFANPTTMFVHVTRDKGMPS